MFKLKNQKIINGGFLLLILLTSMLSWFGTIRGVNEVRGIVMFLAPLPVLFGIICLISLLIDKVDISVLLRIIGFIGIVGMEIWWFFTSYILTESGTVNINTAFKESSFQTALDTTFPEFYFALIIACIAVIYNIVYFIKYRNIAEEQ